MKTIGNYISFDKERQGLYTDLDTLFDTRLACIEQFDGDLAKELIDKGWNLRVHDHFEGFDKDLYEKLYSLRSSETLEMALPTYVKDSIASWILQARAIMDNSPIYGFCEVFINVFPYRLSRDQTSKIIKSISKGFAKGTRVRAINIHPHLITPKDVRKLFSVLFMIDWMDWIEHFAKNNELKNVPLADVSLIVPKLLRGKGTQEQLLEASKIDYFGKIQDLMKPLIGIQFLDTEVFSAIMDSEMLSITKKIKELEEKN